MNAQTSTLAQNMAKDMAKQLAKQMLAQSARLSPTLSTQQSRQRQNTSQIAAAWRLLDSPAQSQWLQLSQIINAQQGRFGRNALNGYNAFFVINSTRLVSNMELLSVAPVAPTPPAGLPPMMLNATLPAAQGDADAPGVSAFTLTISTPNISGLFQIWGCKPVLADKVLRPAREFVLLGIKNGLYALPDISDLYASKFDPPTVGAKVPIMVVALSPEGFRGEPLLLTAIAQAATATQSATGGDSLLKAA